MQRFIAITGTKHYFGAAFLKPGMVVRLGKEADNPYDGEAIRVEMTPIGKIGYVANSPHTVPKGCCSAGRIYDTFEDKVTAVVRFVVQETAIAEIRPGLKEVFILFQEHEDPEPFGEGFSFAGEKENGDRGRIS